MDAGGILWLGVALMSNLALYQEFVRQATLAGKNEHISRLGTLVYLCPFGSKLYGCAVAGSDSDYRGITIPSGKDLLLRRDKTNASVSTRGPDRKSGSQDFDSEFFSLARYLDALASGQTFALDMLFARDQAWCSHGVMDEIWTYRDKLLTSKTRDAVAYTRAQANRYSTRGDRIDAIKGVMSIFEEASLTKPDTPLRDVIDILDFRPWLSRQNEKFQDAVKFTLRVDANNKAFEYLEVCGKSTDLNASVGAAWRMFKAKLDEYGHRAVQAYDAGGADWKALYHAVRVGEEVVELLTTGHITFPRPEAKRLLQIRGGELPLAAVYEEIDELLDRVEATQRLSKLPPEADHAFIEDLVGDVYGRAVLDYWRGAH